MNIPIDIISTIIGITGTAIFAFLGFIFSKVSRMEVRLARIEEHLRISSGDTRRWTKNKKS